MNRDAGAYNLPTTYGRILVTRSSSVSRDHMPDEVRRWRTKRRNQVLIFCAWLCYMNMIIVSWLVQQYAVVQPKPMAKSLGMGKFRPPPLRNCLIDIDETRTIELSPEGHIPCKINFISIRPRGWSRIIPSFPLSGFFLCVGLPFFFDLFVTLTRCTDGPILMIMYVV